VTIAKGTGHSYSQTAGTTTVGGTLTEINGFTVTLLAVSTVNVCPIVGGAGLEQLEQREAGDRGARAAGGLDGRLQPAPGTCEDSIAIARADCKIKHTRPGLMNNC